MIRRVYVLNGVDVEFKELTAKQMSELQKILKNKSDSYEEQMLVFKKSIVKIDKKTVSEDEVEKFIDELSNKEYTLAKIVTNDMNIISDEDINPFLKSVVEII